MQISVVIPTYNRSSLICRAIDSVLQQTRVADQIIVVNDGSTDNTTSLIKTRYGRKISIITSTKNTGVSAARNIGIRRCTGDWIALLDSDDEWLPEKLESQENALHNRAELLCHTEEIWIRNGTRVNPMKKHQKRGGEIYNHCLPLCAISPSSALIHKDLFESHGMFDESMPACEDYDLWLRICAQHSVLFIPSPQLIKYGGHADQLSKQHWGMDRFRIQSMRNMLNKNTLTKLQRDLTIEQMLKKTQILLKGAIKHKNEQLITYCQSVIETCSEQPASNNHD